MSLKPTVFLTLFAAVVTAAATPPSLRVEGYKGIWFTLGQMSEYGDKYSGGLGTYTANHAPMAVYSAKADKTFFVYGGTHFFCSGRMATPTSSAHPDSTSATLAASKFINCPTT